MPSHKRFRPDANKLHPGQEFGRLTVIRRALDPNYTYQADRHRGSKRRSTAWYLVKCRCGEEATMRRFEVMRASSTCPHVAAKPVLAGRGETLPKSYGSMSAATKIFDPVTERFVVVRGNREEVVRAAVEAALERKRQETPTVPEIEELEPLSELDVASIKAFLAHPNGTPEMAAMALDLPLPQVFAIATELALEKLDRV